MFETFKTNNICFIRTPVYEENDNLKRALVPTSKFVQLHQSLIHVSKNKVSVAKLTITVIELSPYILHMF